MKIKRKESTEIAKDTITQRSHLHPPKLNLENLHLEIDDRWMELKIKKNIQPRSHHIAVVHKQTLYLHGGYNLEKGCLSDFYKMAITSNQPQWVKLSQNSSNYPGKLKGHTGIVHLNRLIIFGGQIMPGQSSNNTYVYDFDKIQWTKIQPTISLPKLDSHCAILFEDRMYILGGYIIEKGQYSKNIFELDLLNWQWSLYYSQKSQNPLARGNFGSVIIDRNIWIFGGSNETELLNDLWRFEMPTKKWYQITPKGTIPQPRRSLTMSLHQQYIFLFGGILDVTKQKNDMFLYNPQENQWYKIHSSTNSIYQISPTLKHKRESQRKETKSQGRFDKRISFVGDYSSRRVEQGGDKSEIMKRIIEQTKQKKFIEKKNEMLKQFSNQTNTQRVRKLSPTSQNMIKNLEMIGEQQQVVKLTIHHQVQHDFSHHFIMGKKPCARDGHTAVVYQNRLLIFGGDRYLMPFSDLYFFDLKKGIETKRLYDVDSIN